MDRRRLLLILAVFVALIGTALVFLYVKSASKAPTSSVLVATADIAANETYASAQSAGKVAMQEVDQAVVDGTPGAVTSDTALDGQTSVGPIYQGQVIVAGQFSKNAGPPPTPVPALAIPKGEIAISVNLTDPDRVAGNIENGSHVAIFVTGELERAAGGTTGATGTASTTTTRLLLPDVTVLNVGSPQPPTTSTKTAADGTQTTEQLPRTLLTIAVTQKEAQQVIVSSKALNLTFGLLTDTSVVHPGPGTSTLVASLFR